MKTTTTLAVLALAFVFTNVARANPAENREFCASLYKSDARAQVICNFFGQQRWDLEKGFEENGFCNEGCDSQSMMFIMMKLKAAGFKLDPNMARSKIYLDQLATNLSREPNYSAIMAIITIERASTDGVTLICDDHPGVLPWSHIKKDCR